MLKILHMPKAFFSCFFEFGAAQFNANADLLRGFPE